MRRHPPDILITTPESLYLILTSAAREMLASAETVIVDEIHAMAATKRGTHLALSLERLEHLAGHPVQRIGLSATQRPLEEVARFLGGTRPRGRRSSTRATRKPLDLEVIVPVEDMRELGGAPRRRGEPRQSIWPALYPRLLELVQAHRSTLVFVNSRRSAERVAHRLNELAEADIARAHHGSIAREQRLEIEDMLKSGRLPALVATSSLELGIDMGAIDLVVQVESPKSVAAGLQRVGRAGHQVDTPSRRPLHPQVPRRPARDARWSSTACAGARSSTPACPRQPLDVLAQQLVATTRARRLDGRRPVRARACAPTPTASSAAPSSRACSTCWPAATRPTTSPSCGRGSCGTARRASCARVPTAAALAVTNGGTIPDRGLYGVFLADSGARVGELDEEMVYEARPGRGVPAGGVVVADRADHARPGAGVAGAGSAGADAVLEGRRRRPPLRARAGRGRGRPHPPLQRPRPPRRPQPAHVPRRPGGRDRRHPLRPHDRRRAVPGRDRRLAACACSRPSAAASTRRGRSRSSSA